MANRFKFFDMENIRGVKYRWNSSEMFANLDDQDLLIGAAVLCTDIVGQNPLNLVKGVLYTVEINNSNNSRYYKAVKEDPYLFLDSDSNSLYELSENRQYLEQRFPGFNEGSDQDSFTINHAKYIDSYHSPFNIGVSGVGSKYRVATSGYNPGLASVGCAPIFISRLEISEDISYVGTGFLGWQMSTKKEAGRIGGKIKIQKIDKNGNLFGTEQIFDCDSSSFMLLLQGEGEMGNSGQSGNASADLKGGRGGSCGGSILLLVQIAQLCDSNEFHPLIKFRHSGHYMSLYSYDENTSSWSGKLLDMAWGATANGTPKFNKAYNDFKGKNKIFGYEATGRFKVVEQLSDYTTKEFLGSTVYNNIYGLPSTGEYYNTYTDRLTGKQVTTLVKQSITHWIPQPGDYFSDTILTSGDGVSVPNYISPQPSGYDGYGYGKHGRSYGGVGSLIGWGGNGGNSGIGATDSGSPGKKGGVGAGGGGGGSGWNGGSGGDGGDPGMVFYW